MFFAKAHRHLETYSWQKISMKLKSVRIPFQDGVK